MACECDDTSKSGCCCDSITGLRGGIHPDTILSTHIDLVLDEATVSKTRTFRSEVMLREPGHIVSIDVALMCVSRDEDALDADKQILERAGTIAAFQAISAPVNVSLYTVPGYQAGDLLRGGFNPSDTTGQQRDYICTASVSSGSPSWRSAPDQFGYFFDGGLFVELNAPSTQYGVRVVVNYIPRLQFVPAYMDPVDVMQHYWKCHREGEFLEGFYGGTTLEVPLTEGTESSIAPSTESSVATNPFSKLSDYTYFTWTPIF
jgi:hypothetical protein